MQSDETSFSPVKAVQPFDSAVAPEQEHMPGNDHVIYITHPDIIIEETVSQVSSDSTRKDVTAEIAGACLGECLFQCCLLLIKQSKK